MGLKTLADIKAPKDQKETMILEAYNSINVVLDIMLDIRIMDLEDQRNQRRTLGEKDKYTYDLYKRHSKEVAPNHIAVDKARDQTLPLDYRAAYALQHIAIHYHHNNLEALKHNFDDKALKTFFGSHADKVGHIEFNPYGDRFVSSITRAAKLVLENLQEASKQLLESKSPAAGRVRRKNQSGKVIVDETSVQYGNEVSQTQDKIQERLKKVVLPRKPAKKNAVEMFYKLRVRSEEQAIESENAKIRAQLEKQYEKQLEEAQKEINMQTPKDKKPRKVDLEDVISVTGYMHYRRDEWSKNLYDCTCAVVALRDNNPMPIIGSRYDPKPRHRYTR